MFFTFLCHIEKTWYRESLKSIFPSPNIQIRVDKFQSTQYHYTFCTGNWYLPLKHCSTAFKVIFIETPQSSSSCHFHKDSSEFQLKPRVIMFNISIEIRFMRLTRVNEISLVRLMTLDFIRSFLRGVFSFHYRSQLKVQSDASNVPTWHRGMLKSDERV